MKIAKKKSISVIIPCKNERDNIFPLYNTISLKDRSVELLFGDDHSTDNTKDEIIKLIKKNKKKNFKIKYYRGPGINKSLNVKKGFDLAKNDILIIHDADNTVRGSVISRIAKIFDKKKYQFINCSRMLKHQENNAMQKPNYLGNIFFALIFSLILKIKISDSLCGSKAFLRKDWPLIRRHWDKWGAKDYWGDFNLLLGAKLINLKIYELKVKYHDRKYGETKMTKVFIQFLRMLYISINGFFKLYDKKN